MNRINKKTTDFRKPYKFFDVTADIGFLAYGNGLNEAFENAGLAMFNIISNTDNVEAIREENIEVLSEDLVSLLYDYLEELLFLHNVELLLFSDFNINIEKIQTTSQNQYKLTGTVRGEEINWDKKHMRGSEVKAITFHMMEVKCDKFCKVRAILDL
ncbi:archease [uncultured Methanobrevibacter sp.]|uniref:archease n=1 Tax=uncultured Methanobrevibacter sp. TaxID=253161 RepID=UPI0025F9E9B2|nr:archease [uncultured Methanobrevibacter sp.]